MIYTNFGGRRSLREQTDTDTSLSRVDGGWIEFRMIQEVPIARDDRGSVRRLGQCDQIVVPWVSRYGLGRNRIGHMQPHASKGSPQLLAFLLG
jgi:hypothetical protein